MQTTTKEHAQYIGMLFGAITASMTWRNIADQPLGLVVSNGAVMMFGAWLTWYLVFEVLLWLMDQYWSAEYRHRPHDDPLTAAELPRTMQQNTSQSAERRGGSDSAADTQTAAYDAPREAVAMTETFQPLWINNAKLPSGMKRRWLAELHEARGNGLLDVVSANRLASHTSVDRLTRRGDLGGVTEADYFKEWLIDNSHIYAESKNSQHEWTGKGRAFFPPPLND